MLKSLRRSLGPGGGVGVRAGVRARCVPAPLGPVRGSGGARQGPAGVRGACVRACMCVCARVGSRRGWGASYTYHSFLEIKDPSFWETMFSAMSSCSGSYWKPSVLSS